MKVKKESGLKILFFILFLAISSVCEKIDVSKSGKIEFIKDTQNYGQSLIKHERLL